MLGFNLKVEAQIIRQCATFNKFASMHNLFACLNICWRISAGKK
jgi:hypothetical protein